MTQALAEGHLKLEKLKKLEAGHHAK